MEKKHEHNHKLILDVKDVEIAQTKSNPPRTFVLAFGEARTNASNARLVRSHRVSIPEALQLDFEADDGPLQVITPVRAMFEIEGPHAYREVTVHAASNSITREVPPGGEESARRASKEASGAASMANTGDYTIDANGNISATGTFGGVFGEQVPVSFLNNTSRSVTVSIFDGCGNLVTQGAGPFGLPSLTISSGSSNVITQHAGVGAFSMKAGTGAATIQVPCFAIRTDGKTFSPNIGDNPDVAVQTGRSGIMNIYNQAGQVTLYVYKKDGNGNCLLTAELFGWLQATIPTGALRDLTVQATSGDFYLTTNWPLAPGQGANDGKIKVVPKF